jgi:hypothetical protein
MFGNILPIFFIFIGTILPKFKIEIWKWVGGGELGGKPTYRRLPLVHSTPHHTASIYST